MSDTDRRPLMEAPQMYVHYCEEVECEEWGGWGNSPSPAVAILVVLRAFPTQVIRAGTGTQAEAGGGRAWRYRSTIAGRLICGSLTVGDGDTVKCDGRNMRLQGEGVPSPTSMRRRRTRST